MTWYSDSYQENTRFVKLKWFVGLLGCQLYLHPNNSACSTHTGGYLGIPRDLVELLVEQEIVYWRFLHSCRRAVPSTGNFFVGNQNILFCTFYLYLLHLGLAPVSRWSGHHFCQTGLPGHLWSQDSDNSIFKPLSKWNKGPLFWRYDQ